MTVVDVNIPSDGSNSPDHESIVPRDSKYSVPTVDAVMHSPRSVPNVATSLKSHWPLGVVLAVLAVLIVVINPLRETPYQDDWSYALMVRHLLETGEYQVDNWAAANPIFQIYWGTLFARLFGYSFAILRISTLVMLAAGLCGMYMLAREHGFTTRQAGILTFLLLVSPITLLFGFTYMTDIPFLACTVLGLALYTRAIRLNSYTIALAGSLFAAAAILIRTFGVAFLPGLGLVWLLTSRKRNTLWLFLTAMALPLLALGVQVWANAGTPNWAIPVHLNWQLDYLTDLNTLPPEVFWRIAITLEYLAFFSLPLIPAALAEWWQTLTSRPSRERSAQRYWRKSAIVTVAAAAIFLAVANFVGVKVLEPSATGSGRPPPGWIMPIIGWTFDDFKTFPRLAIVLTVIMLVGATFYARAIMLRYVSGFWRKIPDHQRLLDSTTLVLLVLQITYFQFLDRYLISFLPFILIVVARRVGSWLDRLARQAIALAAAIMVVTALQLRFALSYNEAVWVGGDSLLARGVPAQQISSSWIWACYQGAFNDFIRAYHGHPPGSDPRQTFLNDWLGRIDRSASYSVRGLEQKGNRLELVSTIPYRDGRLRERVIYVYKNLP